YEAALPVGSRPAGGPLVVRWRRAPARRSAGRARPSTMTGDLLYRGFPGHLTGGLPSARIEVGTAQVLLHGVLRDAERAPDARGGQLPAVHEAVHGHLRHPHHGRDLGDRQELHLREVDLRRLGRHPITAFVVAPAARSPAAETAPMFRMSLAVRM